MRAGISVGTYMGNGGMWRCRSPPVCGKLAFFSLEKHTHVLYNDVYEMNKKAGREGRPSHTPLCRRSELLTQHKYYAPIPILLDSAFIRNMKSGDLGPCAVLMAVWVKFLRRLFYLSRQWNDPEGTEISVPPLG